MNTSVPTGGDMTKDVAQILLPKNNELGYCTRTSDGVSGMTVTALASWVGVTQPAITKQSV